MLLFVLFVASFAQEICTSTGVGVGGGVDKIENMSPQRVVYVNIIGPYYYESMKTGYWMLDYVLKTKYPSSTVDYLPCTSVRCTTNWDAYTQIWVADLSSISDDAPAQVQGYRQMANWYIAKERPHLIADGRLLSSLWPYPTSSTDKGTYGFSYPAGGSTGRPNPRLMEDYFISLALRGGGMMLGTDHEPFLPGINSIFTGAGFNPFYGNYYQNPLVVEIDTGSPCVSYPMDASEAVWNDGRYSYLRNTGRKYMWDDSSTSFSPISQQPNGLILYPIGWHGSRESDATRPAISTTIRGSTGFLIDIVSPVCGYMQPFGSFINFQAKVTKGGNPPIVWEWSSSKDGVFGNDISVRSSLTPGIHTVTVKGVDSQRFVAKATVTITLYVSSGNRECYIFARNQSSVVEYYPITTPNKLSAVSYYSYGNPKPNRANTKDKLEDQVPLSANVVLYDDGKNLSLIWVQSENPLPAKLSLTVSMTQDRKVDGRLDFVGVTLRDDPNDVGFVWNPATLSGKVNWNYAKTTKGFILGRLPGDALDRWCLTVKIAPENPGINWMDVYSYPSPDIKKVQIAQYGISGTSELTFCRTLCNCPGTEPRTNYWGFIEPVRWEPGTNNLFKTYNDKLSCSWTITPKGEATPVEGIAFHWDGPFAIDPNGDFLSMTGYPNGVANNFVPRATGTNAPTPVLVKGQRLDVSFNTNNDGKAAAGWILHYYAHPSIFSISPAVGASVDTATVTITGAYFIDSAAMGARLVLANGKIINLKVKYLSSTKIQAIIPPGPVGTAVVQVSNDNHVGHDFWTDKTSVTWEWFDASCGDIKTCVGCTGKYSTSKCVWCNDLSNPKNSFCSPESTGKCPVDARHKKDTTCCSQCSLLNSCNGGGSCQCNDTCNCDPKHWSPDCHCLRCPAGVNKPNNGPSYFNCSGRGTCNCDGSCTCDRGFESRSLKACECKKCEGVPTICSGHGKCECDGTCTCEPGWKHAPGGPPTCSCKTECPNNCSGHGQCVCGTCLCDAGFTEQPDCSCADSCDSQCSENQICGCDGKCACRPGFHGDKCDKTYDCSLQTDCTSCMKTPDCGWCSDANVCENIFNLVNCAPDDELLNPRGFTLADQCPMNAIDSKDVESDNKTSVLVAAVVGSLAVMSLFMLLAAYFWRAVPFETVAHGFDVVGGEAWAGNELYQSAEKVTTSALHS